MYAKKVAFSFFTVPVLGKPTFFLKFEIELTLKYLVLTHQGYEFQLRRKLDKENESKRR